jgi:hypothetical protein
MIHVLICYTNHSELSSLLAVLLWTVASRFTANQQSTSHVSSHTSQNCLRGTSEINDIFWHYPSAKINICAVQNSSINNNLMLSQKKYVRVLNEFHCLRIMCNQQGATELMDLLVSSQQEQSTCLLILYLKLLKHLVRKWPETVGFELPCRKAHSFPRDYNFRTYF